MDSDRFLRIKELFLGASGIPADQRSAWLGERCDDPRMLADVERLLHDQAQDTGRLDTPAFELAGLDSGADQERVGDRIGPFRIEAMLGRGGMGVVYRAMQDAPRRRVALKLIRGLLDGDRVRRLELEAQALALLKHPGIVPLFDTGRTEDGTPWIAMEFVEGTPLDRHVREHALPRDERLALFLELTDAVAHAHMKGIIHRDLKPGNTLVCEAPTSGDSEITGNHRVRVLDFGLARLNAVDLTLATRLTEPGQVIGTLAYMSPEQARSEEVDQRGDVYSLGVILFELLADRRPIDLDGCWVVEAMERIANIDPIRLSSLAPEVDTELETIVHKAMEKTPERRYQSVIELAEDLTRHRDGLPILAHPPSVSYQLRKLLGRHRTGAVTLLVLLLFLLSGGLAFAWRETRHVADVARQRDLAASVVTFQSRLFQAESGGFDRDVTMVTLLRHATKNLDGAFVDQPLLEAEIRDTLGGTYDSIGVYEQAFPHLARALGLRRDLLGKDHPDTLSSREAMGEHQLRKGELEASVDTFEKAMEDRRRVSGPEHHDTLQLAARLATALRLHGELDRAEALYRTTCDALFRSVGRNHPLALETTNEMAMAIRINGKEAEAEKILREVLPRMREHLAEDAPILNQTLANLVLALRARGALDEAEVMQRELVEFRSRLLGEEHPLTLTARNNHADLILAQNRPDEAERILEEVLAVKQRVLGRQHHSTLTTMGNLAVLKARRGNTTEAEKMMREVVALEQEALGADHYKALSSRLNLAWFLTAVGRHDEGMKMGREAAEDLRRVLGEDHPETLGAYSNLGAQLKNLGRLEEAEEILSQALALSEKARGPADIETQMLKYNYAVTLRQLQQADEARLLYEELLDLPEGTLSEEFGFQLVVRAGYGKCLVSLGLPEEAEPYLLEALDGMRALMGEDNPRVRDLEQDLVRLYESLGQEERAALFRQRLMDAGLLQPDR